MAKIKGQEKLAPKGKKDKKAKPSIMKGNSPWESRALREKRAMRPAETKIHRAFVAGKKAARAEMKVTGKTPARTVYRGVVKEPLRSGGSFSKTNPKLPNKVVIKGKEGVNNAYDIEGKKYVASDASRGMRERKAAAYNMGQARAKQMARKKRYGFKQSGNK
jgi:hypothetical protein